MQNSKRNKRPTYIIALVAVVLLIVLWCKCCCNDDEQNTKLFCGYYEETPVEEGTYKVQQKGSVEDSIGRDGNQEQSLNLDSLVHSIKEVQNKQLEDNPGVDLDTIIINSIKLFYSYDSFVISSQDSIKLSKVLALYKNYDKVLINVASHADSRGTKRYNSKLSQKRSNSVVEVINALIDNRRIKTSDFGESKIKNGCVDGIKCNEEMHQQNRRSEIGFYTLVPKQRISNLRDIKSYQISSEASSVDSAQYFHDIQMLRELNMNYFLDQMVTANNISVEPNNLKEKIEETTDYFKDRGIELLNSPGRSSALLDFNFFQQPSDQGIAYVVSTSHLPTLKNNPCSKISVHFLNDVKQSTKEEVIKVANEWFWDIPEGGFYLSNSEAEIESPIRIRTKLKRTVPYKSKIGCKPRKNKSATMWLAQIDKLLDENPEKFRKVILHEFGHVLSRHHEFLHDSIINKINIKSFYYGEYKHRVKNSTLKGLRKMFKPKGVSRDIFDSLSVMNYDIPKKYVKNNINIQCPSKLSPKDSLFVRNELFGFLSQNYK